MKKRIISLLLALMIIAMYVPFVAQSAGVTITIHYHRDDGDYEKWNVWSWIAGVEGDNPKYFTGEDKFGMVAEIPFDNNPAGNNLIGFIIRTDSWEKDTDDDRFMDITKGSEIWVFSGENEFYYDAPAGYEPDARKFDNFTLDFNYFRFDGDYSDLYLDFVRTEGSTTYSDLLPFKRVNASTNSAQIEYKFGAMAEALTATIAIKRGDEVIDYADTTISLTKADENERLTLYAVQDAGLISATPFDTRPAITSASIETKRQIKVLTKFPINANREFVINSSSGDISAVSNVTSGYAAEFLLTADADLDFGGTYTLKTSGFDPVPVVLGNVFDSDDFKNMFTYTGDDLGALYTDGKVSFKLWAPTAAEAQVLLYDTGRVVPNREDPRRAIDMVRGENGTWSAEATAADFGELKGKYYTYRVLIGGKWSESVDPYAAAVGVNGQRGQIIDLKQTNPTGWENDKRPVLENPVDAIIYELHVRDLSTQDSSGIVNKGKFLGIAETGTTSPAGLSTGLDHILELGANYVHLLPSYDYKTVNELYPDDNEFNWGYDPQNYNTPEGSYSTNAEDGSVRVAEFKQMIKTLHENNVGVIMDVVYNHMYDASASNFNAFVPGYYFRMKPDGTYSNGSGCGNETASDREMMRKFMVDSVVYWASEYHIDGFRFDLMGLHDIETMNQIRAALDKIDPSIIIYGEGWTASGSTLPENQQALKKNTPNLDNRIAVFSDDIRDGIKGSVFNDTEPGFVNGDPLRDMDIRFGIVGSVEHPQIDISKVNYSDNFWANEPSQTISYASAHDNFSLWDKLMATNPDASDDELVAMNKLSAAIVLTSQGIPFFQAGEEMARTKNGDHNSYKSPDRINQLNWDRKGEYLDLFEYYKGLIALRKATPEFRMTTGDEIREKLSFFGSDSGVVSYTIGTNIAVIFNGNDSPVDVNLPADGWDILVNEKSAGTTSLGTVGAVLNAVPKGAYVLVKNDNVTSNEPAATSAPAETSTPVENSKFPFNTAGLITALALVCCAVGGFLFFKKKK